MMKIFVTDESEECQNGAMENGITNGHATVNGNGHDWSHDPKKPNSYSLVS